MSTQSSNTPSVPLTFGRVGYDAYGNHPSAHGPWTTFDGRPMPKWDEYSAAGPGSSGAFTQERWEKAAEAIIAEYQRRKSGIPLSLCTYTIDIDSSEAEAAMSRLEKRTEAIVANMERADALTDKSEEPEATLTDAGQNGPVASMTLTAWTPESGVALISLTQGLAGRGTGVESGSIDPFLMGISEIASATRDLAEAMRVAQAEKNMALVVLIANVVQALDVRVSALASPPAEPPAEA